MSVIDLNSIKKLRGPARFEWVVFEWVISDFNFVNKEFRFNTPGEVPYILFEYCSFLKVVIFMPAEQFTNPSY